MNSFSDSLGGYHNQVVLESNINKSEEAAKTVVAQAAIARGLYAAYEQTSDSRYLAGADVAYSYLMSQFYVPAMHAFKTGLGNNEATYTPFIFAVIAGALREATLVGNHKHAAWVYTRFFKKVANKMQLSEDQHTGETGNDSDGDGIPYIPQQPDNLPPVFASEAVLNLTVTGIKNHQDLIDGQSISNRPNPFRTSTQLVFQLPKAARVEIKAYDITGRLVDVVFKGSMGKGQNPIDWRPSPGLHNGIYYLRINVNNVAVATRKVFRLN